MSNTNLLLVLAGIDVAAIAVFVLDLIFKWSDIPIAFADAVDIMPGMSVLNILWAGNVLITGWVLQVAIVAFSVAIAESWIILYARGWTPMKMIHTPELWAAAAIATAITIAPSVTPATLPLPGWLGMAAWICAICALPSVFRKKSKRATA